MWSRELKINNDSELICESLFKNKKSIKKWFNVLLSHNTVYLTELNGVKAIHLDLYGGNTIKQLNDKHDKSGPTYKDRGESINIKKLNLEEFCLCVKFLSNEYGEYGDPFIEVYSDSGKLLHLIN